MKPCPYCAELIQDQAAKCRYCGEWLDPSKRPTWAQEATPTAAPVTRAPAPAVLDEPAPPRDATSATLPVGSGLPDFGAPEDDSGGRRSWSAPAWLANAQAAREEPREPPAAPAAPTDRTTLEEVALRMERIRQSAAAVRREPEPQPEPARRPPPGRAMLEVEPGVTLPAGSLRGSGLDFDYDRSRGGRGPEPEPMMQAQPAPVVHDDYDDEPPSRARDDYDWQQRQGRPERDERPRAARPMPEAPRRAEPEPEPEPRARRGHDDRRDRGRGRREEPEPQAEAERGRRPRREREAAREEPVEREARGRRRGREPEPPAAAPPPDFEDDFEDEPAPRGAGGDFGDDFLDDDGDDEHYDDEHYDDASYSDMRAAPRPLPWLPIAGGAVLLLIVGMFMFRDQLFPGGEDGDETAEADTEAGTEAAPAGDGEAPADEKATKEATPDDGGKPVEPEAGTGGAEAATGGAAPPVEPPKPAFDPELITKLDEARTAYLDASKSGSSKKFKEAGDLLGEILTKAPKHPEALKLMAQVQLEQGQMDESLTTATQCTAIAPDHADCWLTIGVIQEVKREKEPATAAFNKYLELDPEGQYADDARKALDRLK